MKSDFFKKISKTKSLYAVLALCLCGAAIGSYMNYENSQKSITDNNKAQIEEKKSDNAEVGQDISNIPLPQTSSSQEQVSSQSQLPLKTQQTELNVSEEPVQSQKQLYILPVAGEVNQKFSGDILVKNKTLNIWRTHNGVDISSPIDTPVKACNDGKVLQIFEDGVWGVAVKIEHIDGVITTCYGLNKEVVVKEKDEVKLGDIIGRVDVIPAEKEESHIHFEAVKDDKFIDPLTLLTNAQ